MIVNQQNLQILFQGFKGNFQRGFGQHEPQWNRVATRVSSSTRENKYGWLGQVPNVREWLGDRHVQNLEQHDYTIRNKRFELTVGVSVDDISDDQYGVYGPMMEEMGRSVAAHPDQLVFSLLKRGFSELAYDGQYFFDTDHPVLDADGNETSVANTDGGSGTPWFLIDPNRPLKPLLYQEREPFEFTRLDAPNDAPRFWQNQAIYGTTGRSNVGFGFWQFAWGSKQDLTKANYGNARSKLMAMTGDYGRPIGVMPRLLVVPPELEQEGLEILNAERDSSGATNVYKGTAELLVVPWLSAA